MASATQKSAVLTTSHSYAEAPVLSSVIPKPLPQSFQLQKPLNRNPAMSFQAHSGLKLLEDQREHKWTNHSWNNQNDTRLDKWDVVPHEPRPHPDPLRSINVATWTWRGEGQDLGAEKNADPTLTRITGGKDGKSMLPEPPFDWRKSSFRLHLAECALCREMIATKGWPATAPECYVCPFGNHTQDCGPHNTVCMSQQISQGTRGPNLKNTGAGAVTALSQFYDQKGTITTEDGGYGRINEAENEGKMLNSNETNVENPMFLSGNVAMYDKYKKENEENLRKEKERGKNMAGTSKYMFFNVGLEKFSKDCGLLLIILY